MFTIVVGQDVHPMLQSWTGQDVQPDSAMISILTRNDFNISILTRKDFNPDLARISILTLSSVDKITLSGFT